MTALWLPCGVTDLDRATDFYADRVGLSVVDSWERDGERGAVLHAGDAYLEFVANGDPPPGAEMPLAFRLATPADVDAAFRPAADLLAPPHR
ncbi:MAG TPA: VOC family protein, partial [Pseudonocardiaceae bacterium]|nr:VOC family protein [Pseudonocardiaceae bacterium]